MPNLKVQFTVSQHLTHNPFPDPFGHYIFTSYLQPALFYLFGGRSVISYAIYASLITLVFLLSFLLWFVKYHGRCVALDRFKVLAAATFPAFMVPFYWIGMDGMTLLLMLGMMITPSRRWAVLLAVATQRGYTAFVVSEGPMC